MAKKLILTAALITGFAGSAVAQNPTISLSGFLDTQYGYVSQKQEFRYETPGNLGTNKQRQQALVNNTKVVARVDSKNDLLGYGAMIKLNADTSNDKYGDADNAQQTMAYLEGAYGRIEAGSYTGASHALQVNATQLAKGTGGINGDWWLWTNPIAGSGSAQTQDFIVVPTLYTNNVALIGLKSVNSSKITLLTPEYMGGFRAGVSYIPDLESYGTINKASQVTRYIADASGMYHNIFEGGVHFTGKTNGYGLKLALIGQTGDAKSYNSNQYRKLRAWEAGAAVSYLNLKFAGAYGDHGKSGLTKASTAHGSKYWNLGTAYEHGPLGVSLTYANMKHGTQNNKKANHLHTIAVGADYTIAQGVKLYGDVTNFTFKDKAASVPLNNKGTVFLVGSKLNF